MNHALSEQNTVVTGGGAEIGVAIAEAPATQGPKVTLMGQTRVLWLCLPGSDAITGQAIAVAGGEILQ